MISKKRIMLVRVSSNLVRSNFHVRNPKPPLYFAYIASFLDSQGFIYKFEDMFVKNISLKQLLQSTSRFLPSYIIVSCESYDVKFCMRYLKLVRKANPGLKIIIVGQHASVIPEDFIFPGSPADYAIRGECEKGVINLINYLEEGKQVNKIQNLYSLQKKKSKIGKVNILKLPMPKHEMFNPNIYFTFYPVPVGEKLKWGYLISSRGCPYPCTFCSQTMRETYGKQLRLNNPIKVVDEIEYLMKLGRNIISFRDDNFTTSKKHVIKICNEIIKRKLEINWIAQCRIDEVNEQILKKMMGAGCVNLRFGVESGSPRILKFLKKTNSPNQWVGKSRRVFETCRRIGISTTAFFIIGNPGETKKDVLKTITLAKELNPDFIQVAYFTPYPGSEAYKTFNISNKEITQMYHYSQPLINFSDIPDDELSSLYKQFYLSFYINPIRLIKQYIKFSAFYINNLNVWKRIFRMFFKIVQK